MNPETLHVDDARPAGHSRRRLVGLGAICSSLLALAFAVLAGPAAAIPPYVVASPAVQVTGGFQLKGTIYPYGLDSTYHFEYGTTTSYGTNVPIPDADAGASNGAVQVSQTVTNLQPNTTYHFRLVANNSDGPGASGDESFTTPADLNAPPPPPPPPPNPGPAPGPNGSSKTVRVKEAKTNGKTILTTSNGHTLYSLSAEKNGKFICTKSSGCLALWHPLMVPHGATPKGPVKLGTIKRPDGGKQVTYHGRPLYSFVEDVKPGSVKGEGLKDVGTWHAATVSKHKH
jgi:predicted lipoprotein with Yx(FWY)xxD motif